MEPLLSPYSMTLDKDSSQFVLSFLWLQVRCWLFCTCKKSDLTKLYALMARIFENKFHFRCGEWLIKIIFDWVPALPIPIWAEVSNLDPIVVLKIKDKYLFWISDLFIVCRFESNRSNTILSRLRERNFNPWLKAVSKPLVPRLSTW